MINKELIKRATMDKLAAVVGAGAGIAGASAAGTAIGSAGLLGSIGSAVGLTVAVATPAGWLVSGAVLGAAALYGGSKLVGAKGVSDGDIKAHRQFNSENEKQQYMQIVKKLSQQDIEIARKLLKKLPNDVYNEWKADAFDGLDKGSMDVTRIISMCCRILGEDENSYLSYNDFSLTDIELSIKIAILMALSDGELTEDEYSVIQNKVIQFFELGSILNEEEIKLIFSQALGTDEQQKQLHEMSFEEIQTLLVTFVLIIENDRLKTMLIDFLAEIAEADGDISENELQLYNIFIGLLNTEENIDAYIQHIEKLSKAKSDLLYSKVQRDSKTYNKKLTNALKAYAKGIPIESVISLYDATLFGKADNGFIVTPFAIITDQSDDARVIPLGSIYAFDIDKDKNILFYSKPNENGDMPFLASLSCVTEEISEFIDFIQNIVEANLEILATSESVNVQQKWHLAQNNTQLGIYSLQDIDTKLADKELSSENLLVWKEGMKEWVLATEIEEINEIIERYKVNTPPPLPSGPPPLPN
jgi:hypothetical protein